MITVFPSQVQEILWARSHVLVASSDEVGTIVYANDNLTNLFGYLPGELATKTVDDLVPAATATKHRTHRAGFNRRPSERAMGERLPLQGMRKDGTLFAVRIHLIPCFMGGAPVTIAVVYPMPAEAEVVGLPSSGTFRKEDAR